MKVAIMQPYFLPYLGYFQLINAVDVFVVYDNIQFSKKGWIHRNRMLQNGVDVYFTLPLKKDSDYLDIVERQLSDDWYSTEKEKTLRKIRENYKKAPFYKENIQLFESIFNYQSDNLFEFNMNSLRVICHFLQINTQLVISSSVLIDHSLKSQEKVIAISSSLGASQYINPIGGLELYDQGAFKAQGMKLSFLKSRLPIYDQNSPNFVSGLSILDLLMYNNKETIKAWLLEFDLVNE